MPELYPDFDFQDSPERDEYYQELQESYDDLYMRFQNNSQALDKVLESFNSKIETAHRQRDEFVVSVCAYLRENGQGKLADKILAQTFAVRSYLIHKIVIAALEWNRLYRVLPSKEFLKGERSIKARESLSDAVYQYSDLLGREWEQDPTPPAHPPATTGAGRR